MPEHNPMVRLRAHPTRKKAIDAMCAHCMGCTDDYMERGLVRNCGIQVPPVSVQTVPA